jgi:hypothetical protein
MVIMRQPMALAHGIVVGRARAVTLTHAAAELFVHVIVGNDGNLAVAQRQVDHLADQVL